MKRLTWSILFLVPIGALGGDIYKSVSDDGVVTYSDLPSEGAERIVVRTTVATTGARPAAAGDPPGDASGDEQATAGDGTQQQGAGDEQLSAEMPPTPEQAAANCEIATERARVYSEARRLFRTNAEGEREYLTDEELTAARTQAQSDVATWCD